MKQGAIVGPLILIVLGVLFLINNLGWDVPFGAIVRNGWPFVLIGIGVLQLVNALAHRGSITGGLILITVGGLFALQQLMGVSFRYTWPIILIVIGAAGVLRATGRKGWAR